MTTRLACRLILPLTLAAFVIGPAPQLVSAAEASQAVRILLVTGGHDFEEQPFFTLFRQMPGVSFDAVAHPQAHAKLAPDAGNYDVIVLYDMWQPITDEAKSHFVQRLKKGTGLVTLHHAFASYQDWSEYTRIIGGKYHLKERTENGRKIPGSTYLHDVKFRVSIADPEHPVTRGLKDFDIHDETYGGLEVLPNVKILLTTTEKTSHPQVAWAHEYAGARVVTIQLGHDHFAYENPNYRQLLRQAIFWTARR